MRAFYGRSSFCNLRATSRALMSRSLRFSYKSYSLHKSLYFQTSHRYGRSSYQNFTTISNICT